LRPRRHGEAQSAQRAGGVVCAGRGDYPGTGTDGRSARAGSAAATVRSQLRPGRSAALCADLGPGAGAGTTVLQRTGSDGRGHHVETAGQAMMAALTRNLLRPMTPKQQHTLAIGLFVVAV